MSGYNSEVEIAIRDWRKDEWRNDDFEALWRLDQECFPPGISYSREELAAYILGEQSFTYVAKTVHVQSRKSRFSAEESQITPENRISGFIVAETSRRGIGHIITIDVSPKARRFGLGSQLLVAAEKRLVEEKCRAVRLETAVDNLSALAFYKRHHYSIVKTIPRYYSSGVDAFVLEKDLLSGEPPAKLLT
jgi:ribosomal-protein-alanine N-acetyltransferase